MADGRGSHLEGLEVARALELRPGQQARDLVRKAQLVDLQQGLGGARGVGVVGQHEEHALAAQAAHVLEAALAVEGLEQVVLQREEVDEGAAAGKVGDEVLVLLPLDVCDEPRHGVAFRRDRDLNSGRDEGVGDGQHLLLRDIHFSALFPSVRAPQPP